MKRTSAPLAFCLGLAGLAVSAALLARGAPFMKTWFYCFAWWSLLLVLDGVNLRRTGVSPMTADFPVFVRTALVSVPAWLVFEAFNIRLRNWSYHGLPPDLPVRWLGYFAAFATVTPALKEFAALFLSFGRERSRPRRLKVTPALLRVLTASGALMLALPLVAPRLFFPLVWLGFVFLLDPVNYRRGRPSFLRDLEEGRRRPVVSWMIAGLAAGLIWEFLNWWSGSHWEYHIPYLNFGRIFQMPIFGFGGFIPFALEIFALDVYVQGVYEKTRSRAAWRIVFWAAVALFCAAVFFLIDRYSLGSGLNT
jgi:hypothetical protein